MIFESTNLKRDSAILHQLVIPLHFCLVYFKFYANNIQVCSISISHGRRPSSLILAEGHHASKQPPQIPAVQSSCLSIRTSVPSDYVSDAVGVRLNGLFRQ